MRFAAARWVTALALALMAFATAANAAAHTVLDPSRPGRVVGALLEDPDGRGAVATSLVSALPPASRPGARKAVLVQLADPAVRADVTKAVDRSDPAAATTALRDVVARSLTPTHPKTAAALRRAPAAALPATSMVTQRLAAARDRAQWLAAWAVVGAVALAAVAVVVSANRPRLLRHIGGRLLGMGVVTWALFALVPKVADHVTVPYAHLVGALLTAGGGALLPWAWTLVVVGTGTCAVAWVWGKARAARRRAAARARMAAPAPGPWKSRHPSNPATPPGGPGPSAARTPASAGRAQR